jgi:hypothetical protein
MVQKVKGNFENAWGKRLDAARDAKEEAGKQRDINVQIELQKSA